MPLPPPTRAREAGAATIHLVLRCIAMSFRRFLPGADLRSSGLATSWRWRSLRHRACEGVEVHGEAERWQRHRVAGAEYSTRFADAWAVIEGGMEAE
jgi:hypothetical protein